jgi:hypothetical protein
MKVFLTSARGASEWWTPHPTPRSLHRTERAEDWVGKFRSRNRKPHREACSPVTIPTELSQFVQNRVLKQISGRKETTRGHADQLALFCSSHGRTQHSLNCYQHASQHHPASYTMGTGSFPRTKRPGNGVNHAPPTSAKIKVSRDIPLPPPPPGLHNRL